MSTSPSNSSACFTVISVKTTNDASQSAAVVEVACVKIQGDAIRDTLHVLLNPEIPIPEEFTRQTGLYPAMLHQQPSLDQVLPQVASFIGRDSIVWVGQARRNTAIYRHLRLTQTPGKELFLQRLAEKALPHLTSHSLHSLSQHFQLSEQNLQRASGSAQNGAQIFIRLTQQLLADNTLSSLHDLSNYMPRAKRHFRASRRDLPFDRERLKTYPHHPGVYFMKNRLGDILYIGKAKNLRTRLRSYFQDPRRLPSKIAAMMQQVVVIDTMIVGSELEALLQEARLIKQHQPFFNKKIKDYKRLSYIKVNIHHSFPQLSPASEADNPHAAYFGPFSKEGALQSTLDRLNRIFQLRSCNDVTFAEHRQHPCLQYQLKLCSGPCAGLISTNDYQHRVEDFIRYLAGQPSHTIEGVQVKRDAYAENLQFEKAAALQERLNLLERLQLRSDQLIHASQEHNAILVLPHYDTNAFRLLSVFRGQPLQWHTVYPQQDSYEELERFLDSLLEKCQQAHPNPQFEIDKAWFEEARLIAQWIQAQPHTEGQVIFLKQKSKTQLLGELCLALSSQNNETRVIEHFHHDPNVLDESYTHADDEAWEWEQSLHSS